MGSPVEDAYVSNIRLGDLLVSCVRSEPEEYLYGVVTRVEDHDHLNMITLTIVMTPTSGHISEKHEKLDAYGDDRIGQWGYLRRL